MKNIIIVASLAAVLASDAADIKVSDFDALGDGKADDGPAIAAALAAAKADGVPSTVIFENKTYRLGDNPAAWHYFQMVNHEDLVIEGNGATLLCSKGNLAFHFNGGRDITVRGLTLDGSEPYFTQGEVVTLDENGSLDVKIMEGYPEPPDETFLRANKHQAHGGGGRHMIVFEQGGRARNIRMGSDHLYISNITRVSPGVFRFHIENDYLPHMKGMAVGNWISYGFNMANLSDAENVAKDKSASFYGQFAADRVENITFEDINIFGSLNGGIRVSDMPGGVTLRNVCIIRKPGTRNLLSIPSDALHLMNIRGKLLVENCEIEAPGDDCLNVGTLMERIVEVSKEKPTTMTLTTTDNRFYYYTILKGDLLQFLDTKTKCEVGIATVEQVEYDPRRRSHRIVIDRELPAFDPATVMVLNLNQMTSSTTISNNVMRPYMRNAMLVRAQHMTIDGNNLDGSHGGVMGLNFTYAMGESARLRDISVSNNTIADFQSSGIIAINAYRDREGVLDARDFSITDNVFQVGSNKAIWISGVNGLRISGNRFMNDDRKVVDPSPVTEIIGCVNFEAQTIPAEQVGADQPATAPQSKPEGNQNPKPESEVRAR